MKYYSILAIILLLAFSMFSVSAQIIDNPIIEIILVEQDPDPVEAGDYVDLRFSIKNTGKSTGKSVEVRSNVGYPFSVYGEDDTASLGDVLLYDATKEETNEVSKRFRLVVDIDAVPGTYTYTPQYRYYNDPDNVFWQNADPFDIVIASEKTILTITEFYTEPETIPPGQQGTLYVVLENQGAEYLQDIEIKCDFDNIEEFSPMLASNEQTISVLEPGEVVTIGFSMLADASAALEAYKIPLNIDFLDDSGNTQSMVNYVSIVVDTEPEYVLNIEETDIYKAKQPGKVVVSLSNVGASDINYATLTLQEDPLYEIISSGTTYMGNLESDDFETAEFEIYVREHQDKIPLKLNLRYKDNFNNNYDVDESLDLNLFTTWEARKYGLSTDGTGWIVALVVIVLLAVGGYWYYRRRKKKSAKGK